MNDQETIYSMALQCLEGISPDKAFKLYDHYGSGVEVHDNYKSEGWSSAIERAEQELAYAQEHGITILPRSSESYPQRLKDCHQAPIALYFKGNANLNSEYIVSIVGTRHVTSYGKDCIEAFIADLHDEMPDVLIVSGLAYGVDVHAHQAALLKGFDTVGVLAHGLDTIYPPPHRLIASDMENQGGLITEYMSGTKIDRKCFIRRNRIIAGLANATIVVESAEKGGGLITASIARGYNRDVFAFPGRITDTYSAGCNYLIRDKKAEAITSAEDFMLAMRWRDDREMKKRRAQGIPLTLFPEITEDEQIIIDILKEINDLPLNIISGRANFDVVKTITTLFDLESKGMVRRLAGNSYHLINV